MALLRPTRWRAQTPKIMTSDYRDAISGTMVFKCRPVVRNTIAGLSELRLSPAPDNVLRGVLLDESGVGMWVRRCDKHPRSTIFD